MRAFLLFSTLFLVAPRVAAAQQCAADGTPRSFDQRYLDALGGAAAGAVLGAVAGSVIGLVAPALMCTSGLGDEYCDAAWAIDFGYFGGAGWTLGIPLGIALVANSSSDTPLAAGGFGMMAGSLFLAGGVGLADELHDDTFTYLGLAMMALTELVVAPLVALAFEPAPRCGR